MAYHTLAGGVLARGNIWSYWYPQGLKMSGAVVGNPKLRRGTWETCYPSGEVVERRTR